MPVDQRYSGLVVCEGQKGMQQWNFEVAKAGPFFLHVLYASGDTRPVRLWINDQPQQGALLDRVTGGFHKAHLDWETLGPYDLKEGKNSIRITTTGFMPHLAGWVISDDGKQWNRKAFAALFPDDRDLARERIAGLKNEMIATRADLRGRLGVDEIIFIKRITYTSDHYYTEYLNSRWTPGGGIFVLSLKNGSTR